LLKTREKRRRAALGAWRATRLKHERRTAASSARGPFAALTVRRGTRHCAALARNSPLQITRRAAGFLTFDR
jgi:hypothetical protein